MSKRRKKHRIPSWENPHVKDFHHLLYQDRHWQGYWAKRLRSHPYLGRYIPKYTLHRDIHSKIHDIPCPNEPDCRVAFNYIERAIAEGRLDPEHDTCEQRLTVLIDLWRTTCPATVAILEWEREVIAKFYDQ